MTLGTSCTADPVQGTFKHKTPTAKQNTERLSRLGDRSTDIIDLFVGHGKVTLLLCGWRCCATETLSVLGVLGLGWRGLALFEGRLAAVVLEKEVGRVTWVALGLGRVLGRRAVASSTAVGEEIGQTI